MKIFTLILSALLSGVAVADESVKPLVPVHTEKNAFHENMKPGLGLAFMSGESGYGFTSTIALDVPIFTDAKADAPAVKAHILWDSTVDFGEAFKLSLGNGYPSELKSKWKLYFSFTSLVGQDLLGSIVAFVESELAQWKTEYNLSVHVIHSPISYRKLNNSNEWTNSCFDCPTIVVGIPRNLGYKRESEVDHILNGLMSKFAYFANSKANAPFTEAEVKEISNVLESVKKENFCMRFLRKIGIL